MTDSTWRKHVDAAKWVYFGWRKAANEDDEGITFTYLDNVAIPPGCYGSKTAAWKPGAEGPAAFISWLRKAGPITVGPTSPVTLGGGTGLQVDVSSDRVDRCGGFLFVTQTEPGNGFGFVRGAKARLDALDVGGATVLVVVSDSSPDRFPLLSADADAFLATVRFR